MKATPASSSSSSYYLHQFKISPEGPSFTGPGKLDATFRRVFPDGFGQINQGNDTVTWAEVRTIMRPPNRFEVIYCGLRYDIVNTPLPLNRCQTELQMLTHSYDGLLQEKLTLAYQYPNGRWDTAVLVRCEIVQPKYTKTKSGCMLIKSLKDPIQGFERDYFFRKSQHSLISFDNELYFVHRRFRTVKKIIRHDNIASEYDALLKEFGHLTTKKPSKAEVNQGYFNAFEGSTRASIDISKITGCSLEECALEDGEGMIYSANTTASRNDSNEYHLMMGFVDFCTNPKSFPMTNYTLFWGNRTENSFYKGKGILVTDNYVLPHGHGMFSQKVSFKTSRSQLWHQGEFAANARSGGGVELSFHVEIVEDDSSSLSSPEVCTSSLMCGSWTHDKKQGLFTHVELDKTAMGIVYVANQRRAVPYVSKQGDSVSIVAYVDGATADEISFYLILSQSASPRFVKVIDVSSQLSEEMSLIPFFEAINACSYQEVFHSLLFKYATFSDLCFFQFNARLAGHSDFANQFFSSLCGSFPLPDDHHLFLQIGEIASNKLWSYLDMAIFYLDSLKDQSHLYKGALLLKQFYIDPAFQDYPAILSYFVELKEPWLQLQSNQGSMSNENKRKAFESLLLELALPWVFQRVLMIYSSVFQVKALQFGAVTDEEQAVSTMFHMMIQDRMMANLEQSCEALYAQEKTDREAIIAVESRFFTYVLDTCHLSKAHIEAREFLCRGEWDKIFEQLKKQASFDRLEIQEEQRLSFAAMKPIFKRLHVMQECYRQESRKRHDIMSLEVFNWQEMLQVLASRFSQTLQQSLVNESLHRNQILEDNNLFFRRMAHERAALKDQFALLHIENKCRDAITCDEIALFNTLKIQFQLDYVIQYVSHIAFDRPFDVYIVGSAVVNKVLGHDWRAEQDIDVMLVARAPGEFLQISEEMVYHHGLRVSPHIFGLYMSKIYVPGIGPRRVDMKVSDAPPAMDVHRRDFTVGALYLAKNGVTLDPSNRGLFDLRSKQLNTVRQAADSFRDSPVQILRAIKYVMNGYTLSQDIVDAMNHWSAQLNGHQWNHICAVVRQHLRIFDNHLYTQVLIKYGLTRTLFGLPSQLSVEETLRGINRWVFPQSVGGFFAPVEEPQTATIPLPSFFQKV